MNLPHALDAVVSNPTVQTMVDRFRGYLPVVVDVETGGFNSQTDALLEISAVLLTLDEHGYIKPERQLTYEVWPFEGANLEPAALEFTGIDPFHPLRQAVPEAEAMTEIFRFIRNAVREQNCTRAVLVGHNAHFDHGFIKAAAERLDAKRNPFHPFTSFDTASMSGLMLGQTVLIKACKAAGIAFDHSVAHTAEYDALRTAELFCFFVNRLQSGGLWPPESFQGDL